MTSSSPNHFPKAPPPIMFKGRGSTYEFGGDTNSQSITSCNVIGFSSKEEEKPWAGWSGGVIGYDLPIGRPLWGPCGE